MQLVTLEIHPILYRYAWANSTMLNQMHCHRTIPFHNHTVGEEHISYSFVGNKYLVGWRFIKASYDC